MTDKAYDVVVVGAGIGGLTVAALLSARGRNVCLFERQSQVGGCIARVEFQGHDFEPGMGIYTGFGRGEVYDKLFAQLPVALPEVSLLTTPYVVRLADGSDVLPSEGDPRFYGPLYTIADNAASLAERLAQSIRLSGGTLRLDSPVLRLAYDEAGNAIGIDLLSGERVFARTIVSNLTIWDTYGKLVGLNRTPSETKKYLNTLQSTGAYLVYASLEEQAVSRLPSERMLVMAGDDSDEENSVGDFTLALSSGAAPAGKRAVTFFTRTEVEPWFAYQSSEEDYEEWDQAALERFWKRLHAALPELGSDIEIIETANPRTYYDLTRRKLGMVLGVEPPATSHHTSLPNVFIVGDTVSAASRLDVLVASAFDLARAL